MKKKILIFLAAVLLLPGNIYLVYHCLFSASAKKKGFEVEGTPDDFFFRWGNNAVVISVKNNNICTVGAVSSGSDFQWADCKSHFILCYNKAIAFDLNRDFLIDYIKMPDGKMYIQINGKHVPVVSIDFKNFSAALPDGRILFWKNNLWQEEQKHVPHGKECRNQ